MFGNNPIENRFLKAAYAHTAHIIETHPDFHSGSWEVQGASFEDQVQTFRHLDNITKRMSEIEISMKIRDGARYLQVTIKMDTNGNMETIHQYEEDYEYV